MALGDAIDSTPLSQIAVRHAQALKTAHANVEDRILSVTRERDDLYQIVRRASAKSVEGYEGDLKVRSPLPPHSPVGSKCARGASAVPCLTTRRCQEFHAAIVQARDRAEMLTKALFRVPTGPGDATALELASDTFRHAHDLMVKFEVRARPAQRRGRASHHGSACARTGNSANSRTKGIAAFREVSQHVRQRPAGSSATTARGYPSGLCPRTRACTWAGRWPWLVATGAALQLQQNILTRAPCPSCRFPPTPTCA